MSTLDVSATPQVPLTRLAAVEFRKALDTRAGFWFAASIVGLVSVVLLIFTLVAPDGAKDFGDLLTVAGGVLGYFLPILIILLVTSEQSQRNGLVTFTLEPRRSRVVIAKFAAGLALSAVVLALALGLAAGFTALGAASGADVAWTAEWDLFLNGFVLANVVGVFIGFAIAMLLMSTPGGIVAYFAYSLILPIAVAILSGLSAWFDSAAPWIEFNTAQVPLFTGDYRPSAEEWAQIATSGLLWLVLPLTVGVQRLLRLEFK